MEVIENKVITLTTVEINFNEFWDALENLVSDFKNDRLYFLSGNQYRQDMLKKFISKHEEITPEIAKDIYRSGPNQDFMQVIVVDYIAQSNGYSVQYYGMYYRHEQIYKATFQRNGKHI